MDLIKKLSEEALSSIESSGKLKKMIDAKTESMINEILEDHFRSYGDFAKKIKDHLKIHLEFNPDKISINQYTHLIYTAVSNNLDSIMNEKINKGTDLVLRSILERSDAKPVYRNINDFIKHLVECCHEIDEKDVDYDDAPSIKTSFYLEKSKYGSDDFHIYFDFSPEKESWACQFRFYLSKGEFFSATSRDHSDSNTLEFVTDLMYRGSKILEWQSVPEQADDECNVDISDFHESCRC